MARTKQTARTSTGGPAPPKSLSSTLEPKTPGVVKIPPSKKLLARSGTTALAGTYTRLAACKDDPHTHVSFSLCGVLLYPQVQLAVVFDMPQRRESYAMQHLQSWGLP
jgi:hypothetical protein